MKFFKCVVFIIFGISVANLVTSAYIYNDICEKQNKIETKIQALDSLKNLPAHSQARESQLMQGVLMIHHRLAIHPPGKHPMCPMCQQASSPQRVAIAGKEK